MTGAFTPAQYPGLDGKVIFITGPGRGIGRAIAEAFARHGAKLFLMDIDADAVAGTASVLSGVEVATFTGSVTSEADVEEAMEACVTRFGRIDVLVSNAGISMNQPSLDLPYAAWQRTMDINLSAVFLGAQRAARRMKETGGGVILSISSIWGLSSAPGRAAYCASKAGVVSITETLAAEWAALGIRVNAICPGYTRTALVEKLIGEGRIDEAALLGRTPMGRLSMPEEIAEAAVFLASDAAVFMTGISQVVDGGWLAKGFDG